MEVDSDSKHVEDDVRLRYLADFICFDLRPSLFSNGIELSSCRKSDHKLLSDSIGRDDDCSSPNFFSTMKEAFPELLLV